MSEHRPVLNNMQRPIVVGLLLPTSCGCRPDILLLTLQKQMAASW